MHRALGAVFAAAVACSSASPDAGTPPRGLTRAVVVDVVDGDTIRVLLERVEVRVRLIGVDTPEVDGPFTEPECYGRAASRYTRGALDGRRVELEFDVERTDRFDRTLAYVHVDGGLFNETIVRDGFARVATFPPNIRYVDRFVAAERAAGRGHLDRLPVTDEHVAPPTPG